ncbi:MAG TPA: MFS transporter, partial [Candidatus Sulfopaludibacter sp.]|nr:MFS transporter [Candidatus Sulfopaludibacter sp.]
GILSVPMGVFQDKKGKKFVLMLGLATMLAGVLIPAIAGFSTFPAFLLTVLLLGAGATILQVAGNPLMRDASPEGAYSRNLSMAQFVKAIGSLSAPVIVPVAMRMFGLDWGVIFPIFSVAIAIALIAAATLPVEGGKPDRAAATLSSCVALLKSGFVFAMVMAIFLYVGAEVSVSANIPLYLKERFDVDIQKLGLLGTGLFFAALTVGRFSGSVVLRWMKPSTFLRLTSVLSLVGLAGLFVPSSIIATAAFCLVGLGFANVFPLVFSITVDRMPDDANALSGLLVMAIVGGAFLPPLMGVVSDAAGSVRTGFCVPIAALAYIAWVGFAKSGVEAR